MVVGCMRDCNEVESAKLRQSLGEADELLFFEDCKALRHSPEKDKIEVLIGEPPLDVLRELKGLKWLQMTWAGVDMYTGKNVFPEGIRLTNASGVFGKVISEYILAGVLALHRKVFEYRAQMQQGGWQAVAGERTLEGRKALILGAGDIGSETARKLKAFDAEVWGIRRVDRDKPQYFDKMYTMDSLDELLPEADLVIASLPGTCHTEGLMTKERLLAMKKDALLVNVGRRTLLSTQDLLEVLEEGHLAGVLLDVVDPEPLPAEHPLRHIERVILTPHISGVSWGDIPETRAKIIDLCSDNLQRYRKGEGLKNLVDLQQGYRETQFL